jgi:serine phosphatase RsbU (regulator of sigma subunit)
MLKPYPMPDGTMGVIGRFIDLTDQKTTQEEIESLNRELKTRLHAISLLHDNKMRELDEARTLQMSLLPATPPVLPNLRIAADLRTSEEVGGDYYDFCEMPDGTGLVATIGDATGHGLRAGFLVAMVKAYVQLLATEMPPDKLLKIISERLVVMGLKQMYMGLSILHYNSKTGSCAFASAGMPPVLIYRAENSTVERIVIRSMFLGTGIDQFAAWRLVEFTLEPGDVLLLISDGLTETRNTEREMLPDALVDECFAKAAAQAPKAIIEAMKTLQRKWQKKDTLEDDTTLVVIARSAE